jgi:hypothetical protein
MPPFGSRSAFSSTDTQFVAHRSRVRSNGQLEQWENGKKCTPGIPLPIGALFATTPVRAIPAWVVPWNPPWNDTTSPRPVAVLHSLIAASTAFAPVGPQKWIFVRSAIRPGNIDSCASTKASLAGVGRSSPCTNSPSCVVAAATSSGWLCPSDNTPAPDRKSMNTFPSTSRRKLPSASATAIGKCRP